MIDELKKIVPKVDENDTARPLWREFTVFIHESLVGGKKIIVEGDALAKIFAILEAYCQWVAENHSAGSPGPNDHQLGLISFLTPLAEAAKLFGELIPEETCRRFIKPKIRKILGQIGLTEQLTLFGKIPPSDTVAASAASAAAAAGSAPAAAAASSSVASAQTDRHELKSLLEEYLSMQELMTHNRAIAWIKRAVAETILKELTQGSPSDQLVASYCALIEDINTSCHAGEGRLLQRLKEWSKKYHGAEKTGSAAEIRALKSRIMRSFASNLIAQLKIIAKENEALADKAAQVIARFISNPDLLDCITEINPFLQMIFLLNAYTEESASRHVLEGTQNPFQRALLKLLPDLNACAEYLSGFDHEEIQRGSTLTLLRFGDILSAIAGDARVSEILEDPDIFGLSSQDLPSSAQDHHRAGMRLTASEAAACLKAGYHADDTSDDAESLASDGSSPTNEAALPVAAPAAAAAASAAPAAPAPPPLEQGHNVTYSNFLKKNLAKSPKGKSQSHSLN